MCVYFYFKNYFEQDMIAHACDPTIQEVWVRQSWLHIQCELQSKTLSQKWRLFSFVLLTYFLFIETDIGQAGFELVLFFMLYQLILFNFASSFFSIYFIYLFGVCVCAPTKTGRSGASVHQSWSYRGF